MLSLQFLGAAGQVTGSKYFLRTATHRGVLLDCGLFQGGRALREMNWTPFPVQISDIANVVLTHAHLDHTGYIPRLVKSGFAGQVWCTPATHEVTQFILRDSAHLQMEDAQSANRHHYSRHKPALPLYDDIDTERALGFFHVQERHTKKVLPDSISFEYSNAGHILGSCSVLMEKRIDGPNDNATGAVRVLFSGDIGREHPIYLKVKEPPPAADYVVCESTYGDKQHANIDPTEELYGIMKDVLASAAVLVIPAFAVDRAQELIYCLNALIRDKRIPAVPTYVDSPMATSVTALYEKYPEEHTLLTSEMQEPDKNPLSFPSLHFTQTVEDSKRLNQLKGPAIIISASGMATGGRIMHHLANRLPDENTIVLFTGYQAEETLGRDLLNGAQTATIFGEHIPVKARILSLTNFSAHADQREIIAWLRQIPKPPKRLFLTHGEDGPRTILKGVIEKELGWNVYLPKLNEIVDLTV
ncbi:MAG: MBL fold metallo-hydrolase [Bacteroidota bacterium]|nr:MBL fold metallo-hydrolase [Bacteroidota bacterium]MDP4234214.1 MBL fold metallo-hydrolase [Bacteroidota bacterium]MDP4244126.1 MBL fold metallo-hydrolase [Bacteroidota bacterium]MDP4288103.1 MBL fold metallo-hydrolase [Bacteroidota bacterium]